MELITERLLLRPIEARDLDDLVAMHADPVTVRFFDAVTRDEVVEWLERSLAEWAERGYGKLAIVDRESGEFLGRGGLKYWPQFDEVEVGWVLMPGARGRGVATEAGRACLEWGFRDLDVPYITAMIEPRNEASAAVAARLGMTPLRDDLLHDRRVVVHSVRR